MEILPQLNFTALLLIASFIFLLIKLCKKPIHKSPAEEYRNLPPSPSKLPVIGHLHHLIGGLPHHALQRLTQKHGPVLYLQLGEISAVVISSRQAAKEALKDQDPSCAARPESIHSKIIFYNYTNIFSSPYNEYWRQMRKICIIEFLSAKNVRSFGSIRQDEVNRLIKSLQSSSREDHEFVNLKDEVLGFTSSVVCRAAFGKVTSGRDTLEVLVKKMVPLLAKFELADLFPSFRFLHVLCWNKYKLLYTHRRLNAILDAILEEHKLQQSGEYGGEDIVDVLLRMQRNQELKFPITDDNIKSIIFDLFAAGTETSSTVVDWAMAELMRNPCVMAKVQAEIREAFKGNKKIEESNVHELKYLNCVIKETLRLHPPATLLPRACRDECQVDGYSIPLKSRVMVNVWSMGRDPKYWTEPESFKPERFENCSVDFLGNNFEFMPFGTGKRICPGINFGLANIELSLAHILYHFDWKMSVLGSNSL